MTPSKPSRLLDALARHERKYFNKGATMSPEPQKHPKPEDEKEQEEKKQQEHPDPSKGPHQVPPGSQQPGGGSGGYTPGR